MKYWARSQPHQWLGHEGYRGGPAPYGLSTPWATIPLTLRTMFMTMLNCKPFCVSYKGSSNTPAPPQFQQPLPPSYIPYAGTPRACGCNTIIRLDSAYALRSRECAQSSRWAYSPHCGSKQGWYVTWTRHVVGLRRHATGTYANPHSRMVAEPAEGDEPSGMSRWRAGGRGWG